MQGITTEDGNLKYLKQICYVTSAVLSFKKQLKYSSYSNMHAFPKSPCIIFHLFDILGISIFDTNTQVPF